MFAIRNGEILSCECRTFFDSDTTENFLGLEIILTENRNKEEIKQMLFCLFYFTFDCTGSTLILWEPFLFNI